MPTATALPPDSTDPTRGTTMDETQIASFLRYVMPPPASAAERREIAARWSAEKVKFAYDVGC